MLETVCQTLAVIPVFLAWKVSASDPAATDAFAKAPSEHHRWRFLSLREI
jgi:hypothetical protein